MKLIDSLKEDDIYSIILYQIYHFTNEPKYSTLSELVYTLDRKNLLSFCSVFGGCTIKVPTINELKRFTQTLAIYDLTTKGVPFNEAFARSGLDQSDKKEVQSMYKTIEHVVREYNNGK